MSRPVAVVNDLHLRRGWHTNHGDLVIWCEFTNPFPISTAWLQTEQCDPKPFTCWVFQPKLFCHTIPGSLGGFGSSQEWHLTNLAVTIFCEDTLFLGPWQPKPPDLKSETWIPNVMSHVISHVFILWEECSFCFHVEVNLFEMVAVGQQQQKQLQLRLKNWNLPFESHGNFSTVWTLEGSCCSYCSVLFFHFESIV